MAKLIELTYECSGGSCPAVFLAQEACVPGYCPAVFLTEACPSGDCPTVAQDGDDLIIIGKVELAEGALEGRVGPDEQAVRISLALVRQALAKLDEDQGRGIPTE